MTQDRRVNRRPSSRHLTPATFTLLANAYDEARRAVMFLRWKQGADEIAPPIYGRGGGRRVVADVDGRGAAPAEDDGETPVGGRPRRRAAHRAGHAGPAVHRRT